MNKPIIALFLIIACASCRKSDSEKNIPSKEMKTEIQVEFQGGFQEHEFINLQSPTNFYWSSEEPYGVVSYKLELNDQSPDGDSWTYEISEADIGVSKGTFMLDRDKPKFTWSGKIAGLRIKTNKQFQPEP